MQTTQTKTTHTYQQREPRDYNLEPNRFTLKMLYNGEPIITIDRFGNRNEKKADLDCQFYEPRFLGDNPINDRANQKIASLKKQLKSKDINYNKREGIEYEIFCQQQQLIFQDKNNKPHRGERNLFENSWESVEMGDKLIECFRLKLKDGTEDYMSSNFRHFNGVHTLKTSNNNSYTLVLIDNKSVKRNSNGETINVIGLNIKVNELRLKKLSGKATDEELQELSNTEKELKNSTCSRELFRCSFSADDFSYDGQVFSPPLIAIWKDFNVCFTPLDRAKDKNNVEYADVSEFNSILSKMYPHQMKRAEIVKQIEDAKLFGDNILESALENSLVAVDNLINSFKNIHFKGLRSIIKEYLAKDDFTNKFNGEEENLRHLNFYMNSCENEISKESHF